MKGQVIYQENIDRAVSDFDLSDVPSGIYLYKVSDNKKMIKSGKIVISRLDE